MNETFSNLPELGDLDIAEKKERKREKIASDSVVEECEHSYDWISVLGVVEAAFYLIDNRKPNLGKLILQKVEKYFRNHEGYLHKVLVDYNKPNSEEIEPEYFLDLLRKIKKYLLAKRFHLDGNIPAIKIFTHNLLDFFDKYFAENETYPNLDSLYVTTLSMSLKSDQRHKDEHDVYMNIMDLLTRDLEHRTEHRVYKRFYMFDSSRALELARDSIPTESDPEPLSPNVYLHKFGKVSLRDLEEIQDQEEFNFKVLEYLANIPKGDLFWMNLVLHLFFFHPFIAQGSHKEDLLNPEWLAKVFDFQSWFCQKLFQPVFDEEQVDERFDNLFTKVISSFGDKFLISAGSSLSVAASESVINFFFFNPDSPWEEVKNSALIFELAEQQLSPRMLNTHSFLDSKIVYEMVSDEKVWGKISSRFQGLNSIDHLLRGFSIYIDNLFDSSNAQAEHQFIEENLGHDFLNSLKSVNDEIEEVTRTVLEAEIPEKATNWPRHDQAHRISFTEGSVPNLLGISWIHFLTNEETSEPIYFSIAMNQPNISFDGFFSLNGEFELRYFDLELMPPVFYTLLQHIIVMTFRDLVIRERKKRVERKSGRQFSEAEMDLAEGEELSLGHKEESIIALPLIRNVADEEELEPFEVEMIESEDLIADVEEVLKGTVEGRQVRKPVRIPMYRRSTAYAGDYLIAVEHYKKAKLWQKKTARILLDLARDNLGTASQDKQDREPRAFTLRKVTDPDTEEVYVVETWVKPHWNPRLVDGNASLPVKYQRLYKIYFSGSQFLEEIFLTGIGEDHGDTVIEPED